MAYPTNPIYKLIKHPNSSSDTGVLRTINGKEYCIPLSNGNADYKTYLEWVADGNTAEAAS